MLNFRAKKIYNTKNNVLSIQAHAVTAAIQLKRIDICKTNINTLDKKGNVIKRGSHSDGGKLNIVLPLEKDVHGSIKRNFIYKHRYMSYSQLCQEAKANHYKNKKLRRKRNKTAKLSRQINRRKAA